MIDIAEEKKGIVYRSKYATLQSTGKWSEDNENLVHIQQFSKNPQIGK